MCSNQEVGENKPSLKFYKEIQPSVKDFEKLIFSQYLKGEVQKNEKYSIIDGFMYVCVSQKCEMMGNFFCFSFIIRAFFPNFPWSLRKKNEKWKI